MKFLLFLFIFLLPLQMVYADPVYYPNAYVHARVSSLDWVADDNFSSDIVDGIHNFNLSKYSYVLINVTLEYWNPSAVPVTVHDPFDKSGDASGGLLVEGDNNVSIAMPRDLGCFKVYKQLNTGDDADCKAYVESQFSGMAVKPGLSTVAVSTIVRFNKSNVKDWVPGTYQVYPLAISTVPYFVVKNESGVFDFPGELPNGWGSIKGLGYSASLSGKLPLSSIAILYGPILLVILFVIWKVKKKGARKNGK